MCKYDIRCLGIWENLEYGGSCFAEVLTNDIDLAKDFGFVVFFANRNSLSSQWVVYELQYALERGAKMLILLLDEYAKEHYKELFPEAPSIPEDDLLDRKQTSIKVRDLTVTESQEERSVRFNMQI